MQLVTAKVEREPLAVGQPDLADQDAVTRIAVGELAPLAIDVVHLVEVDERMLPSLEPSGGIGAAADP